MSILSSLIKKRERNLDPVVDSAQDKDPVAESYQNSIYSSEKPSIDRLRTFL